MLDKVKCERCGKEYKLKTISENKGKHYCSDCIKKCLVCGNKLPTSNWFGQTGSVTGAFLGPLTGSIRDSRREHIGSGKCNECFYKEKEQSQEPVKGNISERLKTLQSLLDNGVINLTDYEKRKAEILAQV